MVQHGTQAHKAERPGPNLKGVICATQVDMDLEVNVETLLF